MTVTASMVKELREKTGVGMLECKKALTENAGDLEKSILWLRERGLSRAAKKADRVAAEGIVAVKVNDSGNMGTLVERNCETDFVSKNEEFQAFAAKIADVALSKEIKSIDALLAADFGTGTSVADTITSMIATIGENIKLRRVESLTADGGVVAGYSHMGGKIGTLVAIEGEGAASQKELASDIAMHIAAFNPKYLDSKTVDTADLEQEKAIAKKKLIEEGKPEDMIEKILVGQMNKYFKEVCLVNQAFVKDSTGKTSVEKHIEQTAKGCSIKSFVRFGLGEGIEKKQEDFAAEVQAALN